MATEFVLEFNLESVSPLIKKALIDIIDLISSVLDYMFCFIVKTVNEFVSKLSFQIIQ